MVGIFPFYNVILIKRPAYLPWISYCKPVTNFWLTFGSASSKLSSTTNVTTMPSIANFTSMLASGHGFVYIIVKQSL